MDEDTSCTNQIITSTSKEVPYNWMKILVAKIRAQR